jgi:hypothetical protein
VLWAGTHHWPVPYRSGEVLGQLLELLKRLINYYGDKTSLLLMVQMDMQNETGPGTLLR